jgi:hypothetical protein
VQQEHHGSGILERERSAEHVALILQQTHCLIHTVTGVDEVAVVPGRC